MSALLGCAGALGLVAFVGTFSVAFIASLFSQETSWSECLLASLGLATMVGGMTFMAALLLGSRDWQLQAEARRTARANLLDRPDTSDEQYVAACPTENAELLLAVRRAIAWFFEVPAAKVARDVHLVRDLHVDQLEPAFQFSVLEAVIASQSIKPSGVYGFSMTGITTADELTAAISKLLDSFAK